MKKIAVLSLLVSSFAFAATTGKYNSLEGNWSGKITKNFKMSSAGGKPTAGDTGAPAAIKLAPKADGLEGTSTTGTDSEKWVINGDTYTWTDAEMSVSSKATTKLPAWVQAEVPAAADEQVFAFKFDSCVITKTSKPCEVKTHIPEGLTDGYWLFKVKGNKLTTAVLYKYPTGGIRHLSEELTK
jgi:hypothetical protein